MRTLDADKVLVFKLYDDLTEEFYEKEFTIQNFIDTYAVDGCPKPVDAEPIRHGHWTPYEYGDCHWHKCSVCGVADKYIETVHRDGYPDKDLECIRHYCPNCGAKMDEVEE